MAMILGACQVMPPIFAPAAAPEVAAAKRLGEIAVPTLVFVGEMENEYQHKMVDISVQGIRGAQKVVMPKADHFPFLEDPESFNTIVQEFLAKVD
jgi:pimeloyl-ACP methyl ester carboxylesterase